MLNKLLHLTPRERWLLIKALALLPIAVVRVKLNLAVAPPEIAPAEHATPSIPVVVGETVRMVKAAARVVKGATCLPQSMVVQRLLGDAGVPTTLRIGVRKSSGALAAHAWVEYAGHPITDPPAVHHDFTVLAADSRS